MYEPRNRRLLVVANLTASAPRLLDEVQRRAREDLDFALMVPPERHPDAPDWSEEDALELVRRAAHPRPVEVIAPGADAAGMIGMLAYEGEFDEILLCTPPEHHARWHRHGLVKRIQALQLPVTVIPPEPSGWSFAHGYPEEWVRLEVGPLT